MRTLEVSKITLAARRGSNLSSISGLYAQQGAAIELIQCAVGQSQFNIQSEIKQMFHSTGAVLRTIVRARAPCARGHRIQLRIALVAGNTRVCMKCNKFAFEPADGNDEANQSRPVG